MIIIENFIKKILRIFGLEIKRLSKNIHPLVSHKIDLLIDIGANTGQYSLIARKIGYKNEIISFEPLEDAYNKLLKNSKNDPLWTIQKRCGIGNEIGKKIINVSKNSYSSSLLDISLEHVKVAKESKYIDKEEIDIITLDSFFDENQIGANRIFLKIDTQGYEDKVLDGFSKNISRIYAVQIELSTVELYENQKLYSYFVKYFTENNFFLWNIERGFSNTKTGQNLQFEAIFINRNFYNSK